MKKIKCCEYGPCCFASEILLPTWDKHSSLLATFVSNKENELLLFIAIAIIAIVIAIAITTAANYLFTPVIHY